MHHAYFDLNFTNAFSSSGQDIAASAASKELSTGKVEYDVHQGDEVVASAVEELIRTHDNVKL